MCTETGKLLKIIYIFYFVLFSCSSGGSPDDAGSPDDVVDAIDAVIDEGEEIIIDTEDADIDDSFGDGPDADVHTTTVYVATDGSGDYNCDGVDDHIDINQAIDYISSMGGGTVHIESGTCVTNDSVVMKSNVTLEGEGSSTTIIKLMDNCTYPAIPADEDHQIHLICSNAGMPRYPDEITNITIRNLQLDANKRGNPTHIPHSGVQTNSIYINSTHSIYESVLIKDPSREGLRLWGHHNDIIDCEGELIGHDAIRLSDNTYTNVTNFTNNLNGNNVIRLTSCQHCILDNIVGRGGDNAIQLQSSGYGQCDDNTIKNSVLTTDAGSAWNAIVLNQDDSGSLSGNKIINTIIYDTHSHGISINGADNTEIVNCVIYESGHGTREASAINIDTGSGTTVKNTIILNSGGYGISGDATSTYNNMWNNILGDYNGTSSGTGDTSVDPIFANPENHDFHLKSTAGRWNGTDWINDAVTSPCIDAGDPNDDCSYEQSPNGGIINMGAYGNTGEASKSSSGP